MTWSAAPFLAFKFETGRMRLRAGACPGPSALGFPHLLPSPSRMMLPSLRFFDMTLFSDFFPLVRGCRGGSSRRQFPPSTIVGTTEASQGVSDPVNPLHH